MDFIFQGKFRGFYFPRKVTWILFSKKLMSGYVYQFHVRMCQPSNYTLLMSGFASVLCNAAMHNGIFCIGPGYPCSIREHMIVLYNQPLVANGNGYAMCITCLHAPQPMQPYACKWSRYLQFI